MKVSVLLSSSGGGSSGIGGTTGEKDPVTGGLTSVSDFLIFGYLYCNSGVILSVCAGSLSICGGSSSKSSVFGGGL